MIDAECNPVSIKGVEIYTVRTNLKGYGYPVYKNPYNTYDYIKSKLEVIYNIVHINDTLVCTGTSGIVISNNIALLLKQNYNQEVNIKYLTKSNESRHNEDHYELDENTKRIIIVDDFVSMGGTMERIYNKLIEVEKTDKVTGIICNCSTDIFDKLKKYYPNLKFIIQ